MEPLNISNSRAALSRKSHQLSTFPQRNSVSMEPNSSSKFHTNQHHFRIQKQQSPFRLRDPFAPEINAEELSELFADILLADNPAKQRKSCFGLLSGHANHPPKEHSEAPKFSVFGQHTQMSAVTEDRNEKEKIDEKADFIKTASKHQTTPNHEGAPSMSKTLNTESCNQYKMAVSRCTEKGTNSTLDPSSLENLTKSCVGTGSSKHIDTETKRGFFIKKQHHANQHKHSEGVDLGLALQSQLLGSNRNIRIPAQCVGTTNQPAVDVQAGLCILKVDLASKAPEDTVIQRQKAYQGYINEHKEEIRKERFPKPRFLKGTHRSLDKPSRIPEEPQPTKYLARADLFKRQSISNALPSHWAPVSEYIKNYGLEESSQVQKRKPSSTTSSDDKEVKNRIKVIRSRDQQEHVQEEHSDKDLSCERERAVQSNEEVKRTLFSNNKHLIEYPVMYNPLDV